jgi:ATP-binding cassette, subfamily B, bacterial
LQIPFERYRALLVRYLSPHRHRVFYLSLLLFGSIGLQLYNPQILRDFIDAATAGVAHDSLIRLACLFIGVAIGQQVLAVWARYASEKLGWLATNALREDLASHCLKLDLSFHNRHTPGEMIERIDGDVASLANFFSQFVIRILGNAVLLVGVLAVLYAEDWRVGVALTLFSAVTMYLLIRLRNIAVPAWKEARQASADLYGFVEEHLGGIEDIRANGASDFTENMLYDHAGKRLASERRASVKGIWLRVIVRLLRVVGLMLAFGAGYILYKEGSVSLGTVFMVITYTNTLFRPLEQLTSQLEDLQRASASIERIDELYHEKSRVLDGTGVAEAGAPEVVFDGVDFAYGEGENVLHRLSFTLESGKVLGLLGRTGSGKTTIGRLLLRLYDVQQGAVRLDGADICDFRLEQLRRRIGVVTQNVQLFRGTVRDNLVFCAEGDEKNLKTALERVGLGDWLEALPQGLDTPLDSGGGGLSAGEAQLLTFARVFLQDPDLVILDEATSRLDPATEGKIEAAVDQLLQGRTGIVIAHHLGTVQRADQILILDQGRVLECGGRQELAGDSGSHFYRLLKTGFGEVLA